MRRGRSPKQALEGAFGAGISVLRIQNGDSVREQKTILCYIATPSYRTLISGILRKRKEHTNSSNRHLKASTPLYLNIAYLYEPYRKWCTTILHEEGAVIRRMWHKQARREPVYFASPLLATKPSSPMECLDSNAKDIAAISLHITNLTQTRVHNSVSILWCSSLARYILIDRWGR